MKRGAMFVCASALACGGCASSIQVERFDGTPATMTGVPYNLPMTVYTLTVTRHVTGCGASLQGSTEVMIASALGIDPSAMFTLHSDGVWSTSDIKSTFGVNGVTTGLNTDTADVTATVISDLVSTAAAIAPLAAAAGAGAAGVEVCDGKVSAAVTEIKTLKDTVSADSDALTAATSNVTLLTAELSALGSKADQSVRQQLADALVKQDQATKTLAADQKKLAADVALTTDTQTIVWPQQGTDPLDAGPFSLPQAAFDKWTIPAAVKPAEIDKWDIYINLARTGVVPAALTTVGPGQLDVSRGVPVRFAVPGRLSVCDLKCAGAAPKDVLAKSEGQVLQIGFAYSVPIKGGQFQSVTGGVTYDAATGAPTVVEVQHKAAAATTVSGALKSSATTVAGIPAQVAAAQLAAVKAKSDLLNAQTTLVTAQANNVDAATLAPTQAEVALAQAQLALINANNAIAAAKATQAATHP